MITGITAGLTWALETVVLGIALSMSPFVSDEKALFLAPFVSTFIHDFLSALYMLLFNGIKKELGKVISVFKTSDFKWIVIASAVGGPVGMTGYVLAVTYMGASIGAVASAVYPAIGTVLAFFFLKEKVKWYQWIFLLFTLAGVYGLSYSPTIDVRNFWLGLCGVIMCSFGWGIEGVILSKCLKNSSVKSEYALQIRQTVSALIYGIIVLPVIGGWEFMAGLLKPDSLPALAVIAAAAFFATVSYLFYYKTIASVGTSKAMSLNITYTAWAMIFSVIISRDFSQLNAVTVVCADVVVICGIFAAVDIKMLLQSKKK